MHLVLVDTCLHSELKVIKSLKVLYFRPWHALGIWICGCSIEESSGIQNPRVLIVLKASISAGTKILWVRAPTAPMLTYSLWSHPPQILEISDSQLFNPMGKFDGQ